MNGRYRILNESNEDVTYAFESIEMKANFVEKDGYRLIPDSIKLFFEDRGPTQMPLYHVTVVMEKTEIKEAPEVGVASRLAEIYP